MDITHVFSDRFIEFKNIQEKLQQYHLLTDEDPCLQYGSHTLESSVDNLFDAAIEIWKAASKEELEYLHVTYGDALTDELIDLLDIFLKKMLRMLRVTVYEVLSIHWFPELNSISITTSERFQS